MAAATIVIRLDMVGRFTLRRRSIMAGETGTGNVAVIKFGWHPCGCGMTVATGVSAWNVIRGLTRCSRPVVTAETRAGYRTVVKTRIRPCHRTMAVLAIIAGQDMSWALALGLHTIVTGYAGPRYGRVVHTGIGPAELGMTIITAIAAFYMIRAFLGRRNGTGCAMTSLAARRRSFKDSMSMACFTTDPGMRTIQQKSGRIVIEVGRRIAVVHSKQKQGETEKYKYTQQADCRPVSDVPKQGDIVIHYFSLILSRVHIKAYSS